MNKKMIARFIGKILMVEAVFMLPAYAISVFQHEAAAAHAFFITFVLTLLTGGILSTAMRGRKTSFHAKEGMVCVGLSWMVLGLFGALPFSFPARFRIMWMRCLRLFPALPRPERRFYRR